MFEGVDRTEERTQEYEYIPTSALLLYGSLSGFLAGVVFGVQIQFVLGVMPAIGAMYTLGEPSLTVGWVAHVVHAIGFGVFYAFVASHSGISDYTFDPKYGILAGVLFGFVLWSVNIVWIWPMWLGEVGAGAGLSAPNLAVKPLIGHVIWGALVGLLVPAIHSLRHKTRVVPTPS